jgi:hypothetical protein
MSWVGFVVARDPDDPNMLFTALESEAVALLRDNPYINRE